MGEGSIFPKCQKDVTFIPKRNSEDESVESSALNSDHNLRIAASTETCDFHTLSPWVESSKLPRSVLKFKEKEQRNANRIIVPVAPWTIDDVVWKNYASNAGKHQDLLQQYGSFAQNQVNIVKRNYWALKNLNMDSGTASKLKKEIVSIRKKLGIDLPMFDSMLFKKVSKPKIVDLPVYPPQFASLEVPNGSESSNFCEKQDEERIECEKFMAENLITRIKNRMLWNRTRDSSNQKCENVRREKALFTKNNEPKSVSLWLSREHQKLVSHRGKRKSFVPRKVAIDGNIFVPCNYTFIKKRDVETKNPKESKNFKVKQEKGLEKEISSSDIFTKPVYDDKKLGALICDEFSSSGFNTKNRGKNQKVVKIGKKRIVMPQKKHANEILAAFGLSIDRFDHVAPHVETSLEKKTALDAKKQAALSINGNVYSAGSSRIEREKAQPVALVKLERSSTFLAYYNKKHEEVIAPPQKKVKIEPDLKQEKPNIAFSKSYFSLE